MMRYHILAADFDGTLAHDGIIDDATIAALAALRESGRRVILVTGRRLEPLLELLDDAAIFERIVAENGAVVYDPLSGKETLLAPAAPDSFVNELRHRGVEPLEQGRCIVATWQPHELTVLEVIRDLSLDMQIIFNKNAVMVLPSGINKAAGLAVALEELGMSSWNTVAVGDAENDEAMLRLCSGSAAVENAVQPLKELANVKLTRARGAGVQELISMIIQNDLSDLSQPPTCGLTLGTDLQNEAFMVPADGKSLLVVGGPGGGKSRFTLSLLDRLTELGVQCCIIDPEGDYQQLDRAINVGNAKRAASIEEVINALNQPADHCVVSFHGIEKSERATYFGQLHQALMQLRTRTGRPHWIIVDEAHYAVPKDSEVAKTWGPNEIQNMIFVTAYHDAVSSEVLANTDWIISIAADPTLAIADCCELMGVTSPRFNPPQDVANNLALAWHGRDKNLRWFVPADPESDRKRHQHSHFEGEMDEEWQFVFRGVESKLRLATPNLKQFINLATGVDDDTWNYHLQRNDYSSWFREILKNDELADEAQAIENDTSQDAQESRDRVFSSIRKCYAVQVAENKTF